MIELPMWTIYCRPTDYPNHYVVRRCVVIQAEHHARGASLTLRHDHECQLADSLEEARKLVPPGLFNLHRQPEDEPQIVETWA